METVQNRIQVNRHTDSLMTKRESELIKTCASENIERQSSARIRTYAKLFRNLRDKYRDLAQRQKVSKPGSLSLRTIEKARIFDDILSIYERMTYKPQAKPNLADQQAQRDHDEHYDIDGFTIKDHKVVVRSPLNLKRLGETSVL